MGEAIVDNTAVGGGVCTLPTWNTKSEAFYDLTELIFQLLYDECG